MSSNKTNLGKEEAKEKKIIHISSQLSSKMIMNIMDEYPNLKKITCPPSLYQRISYKYLEVLEELGIEVEIKHNWGSKQKYSDEKKEKILYLIKKGQSPSEIAKKLNISTKTVYYLKYRKEKDIKDKNNSKKIGLHRSSRSKYSIETRKKVKELANEGISPKIISKQENIPLRTVYYIIKN